jgi:hypothetical protein
MKLSFLPGDLHLSQDASGFFVVSMCGRELLSTKSRRSAVARFNAMRVELESKFPRREPTREEKLQLLQSEINNSLVGHNSLGGRKKKTTAGGTRTFGG